MAVQGRDGISARAALIAVVATVGIVVAILTDEVDPHVGIGSLTLHHWLSWAGATFIAAFTPAFYVLRRRGGRFRKLLIPVHVFGGLAAFAAVSFHFARHIARLDLLEPGAGVVLYSAVLLSVISGLLMRYRVLPSAVREWRLLHDGSAVAFFLAVAVHLAVRLDLL